MPVKQEIIWYSLDEKEPPDLIKVIFKIFVKFNGRKTFREGYYNKELNKFYLSEFKSQYHTENNFVDLDNKFIKILQWAQIL